MTRWSSRATAGRFPAAGRSTWARIWLTSSSQIPPTRTARGTRSSPGPARAGLGYLRPQPGDPLAPFEDPADHGKPFPVKLPSEQDITYGQMYSGSPFLGTLGALPPGRRRVQSGRVLLYVALAQREGTLRRQHFPGRDDDLCRSSCHRNQKGLEAEHLKSSNNRRTAMRTLMTKAMTWALDLAEPALLTATSSWGVNGEPPRRPFTKTVPLPGGGPPTS